MFAYMNIFTHKINNVIMNFCQIKFCLLWLLTSGLPQLRADFSPSSSFRVTLMSQLNSKQWFSRILGIFYLTCHKYPACNWKLTNSFLRTWFSLIMCYQHKRLWFSPFRISKHLRFWPLRLSTFMIIAFRGCALSYKHLKNQCQLSKSCKTGSTTSCYTWSRTCTP